MVGPTTKNRKKTDNSKEKWAKDSNTPFREKDLQMANKHEKGLNFISHTGNANSNHNATPLTHTRMPEMKKVENTVCEEVKNLEPSRLQVGV